MSASSPMRWRSTGSRWWSRARTRMAGPPMAGRRDAMMAAAPLIAAVEEIALATLAPTGEPGRGTVGVVEVYPPPAATSRPAGSSSASISATATPMPWPAWATALTARAAEISAARKVTATVTPFWYSPHTPFDATLVGAGARLRQGARPDVAGDADGHRPRRGLHGAQGADGDDLHPLPWRAEPQRGREHHPGMGRRPGCRCWPMRRSPPRMRRNSGHAHRHRRLPAREPFLRPAADRLARIPPSRRLPRPAAPGDHGRDHAPDLRPLRRRDRGAGGGRRHHRPADLVLRQPGRPGHRRGLRAHRRAAGRQHFRMRSRRGRSTASTSNCTAPWSRSASTMRRASCCAGSAPWSGRTCR